MTSAASLTSNRPRSLPPVTLKRMPRAPVMLTSSSGLMTAARAASTARFSPVPMPMPIIDEPASRMIVLTSAKSRLMRPGTVIRSLMPCTPWRSTSSTTRKASRMEVFLSTTSRRRSFGMVISVSHLSLSCSEYCSATSLRRTPSKLNGLVMTPTVSAPRSFATSAMTGAAP